MSGEYAPARFREWPLFLGNPNPYSSGALTRSPSAVVANPGSITMPWIVFPDWATTNCALMGGWSLETVGSGAVGVDRVGARATLPARRNVAVNGNRVKLCQIPVAVEAGLGEAIHQQLRSSARKENCSVDCKGVRALDAQVAAKRWQGPSNFETQPPLGSTERTRCGISWCLQIFSWAAVGFTSQALRDILWLSLLGSNGEHL